MAQMREAEAELVEQVQLIDTQSHGLREQLQMLLPVRVLHHTPIFNSVIMILMETVFIYVCARSVSMHRSWRGH
jgi:hypothetical protein